MESSEHELEAHRFRINPESLGKMRNVVMLLDELKKEYPFLVAVAFFGSRTVARETATSDLDFVAFYDSRQLSADMKATEEWRELLNQAIGVIFRSHESNVGGYCPAVCADIDPSQLEEGLDALSEILFTDLAFGTDDALENYVRLAPLCVYFFISPMPEVLQTRRDILLRLAKRPDGKEVFSMLMESLRAYERRTFSFDEKKESPGPLPRYSYLPRTIEEGLDYFCRDQEVHL